MRAEAGSLRHAAVGVTLALIACVFGWSLSGSASLPHTAVALVVMLPLALVLRGQLKGNRRAYAWTTLAIVPSLVMALTEVIANPAARWWAASCLLMALVLFAIAVGYLRATRAGPAPVM